MRRILELLGLEVVYVHRCGEWKHRYNGADFAMGRPVHRNMSVAPPGAKMVIRKITG